MKATTVSNQGSIRSFLSKRKAASISEKQSILIVGTSNKRDEQPILNIGTSNTSEEQPTSNIGKSNMHHEPLCKSRRIEVDLSSLARDPALRSPIWKYDVNQRDEIRRAYIKMGPYQPILPKFPATQSGKQNRRFQSRWYKQFTWLEYSPLKDKVFCFPCFLFENELARHSTFTTQGFSNWKRVNDGDNCACLGHVGGINSPHCKAMKGIDDLLNVNRHIEKLINEQSIEEKRKNRLRLTTSIESVRLLSMQGCAFRGHDESPSSNNRGNMIEVIKSYGRMDPNIKAITLENAPQNAQYVTSKIQKDILHVFAQRIRNKIREEVGEANFCILVDEARDVSDKEQMAIVLRFVDVNGFVKERFFAIVEVEDTIATTLKKEVSDALGRFNLNIKDLRGQGYDGASNMRGIWNGLQALFLRDSPSAYYVHCFAHRLQLALVAACEKEESIWKFFSTLNCIVNLITVSPKRQTQLRSAQAIEIANMVANGERETGKGANQVGGLRRAGKTRWSSHFESICSVIDMYGSVITVLEFIRDECSTSSRTGVNMRNEAKGCLREMRSFKFIFVLYLMHRIMAITDLLCRALQHKALDIVNAMSLVKSMKELLQGLRDNSFDIVLTHVESICPKFGIAVPNMDDLESDTGRSCQQQDGITWRHYFQFEVFNSAIDFQVEELNSRFNDDTVELLTLRSALEPKDNFSSLDVDKIYTLAAKFYSDDFSEQDLRHLSSQLIHYQKIMPTHVKFQDLTTISELCRRLVETNLKQQFNMIDRLVRLVLTLPVSTASAERIFSSLKNVKTDHRNKMGEEFLADSLMIYVEREIAESIDNETIISDFYEMKERRAQV